MIHITHSSKPENLLTIQQISQFIITLPDGFQSKPQLKEVSENTNKMTLLFICSLISTRITSPGLDWLYPLAPHHLSESISFFTRTRTLFPLCLRSMQAQLQLTIIGRTTLNDSQDRPSLRYHNQRPRVLTFVQ